MDSDDQGTTDSGQNTEREKLLNNVWDLEVHCGDLRGEILRGLAEYRHARKAIRAAERHLSYFDYIESIHNTFGPEMAAVVAEHSDEAQAV